MVEKGIIRFETMNGNKEYCLQPFYQSDFLEILSHQLFPLIGMLRNGLDTTNTKTNLGESIIENLKVLMVIFSIEMDKMLK